MSTTIDQRVVEMQFDNKQFESNVSDTMSTLDKLKQKLNLNGATKGLEEVDRAAKSCNIGIIGDAVHQVGLKFNSLYTIADQALRRITDSAMMYGKKIISSLTIDPIKMGFQEYETQINAVQTILANTESKGKTLDDVNSALDELNAYADKTIYNFTEMTRNIGTFTAAGVDLDTSVSAIKGIANLAAVSGSTSQQASTAMYQLSQALASGTVKLMDWNSVVNAGMGGQVFQDALKETARVHGIAIDDLIAQEGSFRETLSKGWLTSEILTETLSKFTGDLNAEQLKTMGYTEEQIQGILKMGKTANDAATKVKTFSQLMDTLKEAAQSGWTQTWEILVGDFEEAKELLTKVSDTIGEMISSSAEARNSMLENWKEMGGRADVIESIGNVFKGIMSVITPIKDAFRDIFPPMTAEQLFKITENLKNLTSKLTLSDSASSNLKSTFRGLFAVVDIVKEAFTAIVKAIFPMTGGVAKLGGGILEVTGTFGDWLVKLRDFVKSSDVFTVVLGKISGFVKLVIDGIASVIGFIKSKFKFPGFESFSEVISKLGSGLTGIGEIASKMKNVVVSAFNKIGSALTASNFGTFISSLWGAMKIIGSGLAKAFGSLASGITKALGNGDLKSAIDTVNSIVAGGLGISLIKFIKGLNKGGEQTSIFADLFDGVKGILDDIRGCLSAWQDQLKAGTLLKIAGAIGILAAAVLVLTFIDNDKLAIALGAISTLFVELVGVMSLLSRIGDTKGMMTIGTTMIGISVAVLLLASALKMLSKIDTNDMIKGVAGVAGLTAIVVVAAKALASSDKKVIKGAVQMVIFAAAIKILASACKDLSSLSWNEMGKGLVGVGVLLAEVAIFLKTAKFSGKAISTATGIVILAAAIKILASSCSAFANMATRDIVKGLSAIGILLVELAAFTKLTGNAKNMMSTGIGMIAIATAIKILGSAMSCIANLSWEEIARGLVGMAGGLAAVTIAVNLMPKNLIGTGIGLIAVSAAMVILSNALRNMALMSWEEIGRGMTVLGGALLILAVGLAAMSGTLSGSAALLVAAAAISVFTPSIMLLGTMSWEAILKSLVTLAGVFTILGVAGLALGPVTPIIIGLAAAFALIGVGALALGLGLSAIAVGLTALATATTAGAAGITAAIIAIGSGLAGLIPVIVAKLGEALLILCQIIIDAAPSIGLAVTTVLLAVLKCINDITGPLLECLGNLLVALLGFLVQYTPMIVDAGFKLLLALLAGIRNNIGSIVTIASDIIVNFLNALSTKLPEIIQAGFNLVISFIDGLTEAVKSENGLSRILASAGELAEALLDGFIDGIFGGFSKIGQAMSDLGKNILDSIKSFLGIKSPSTEMKSIGDDTVQGFIKGIGDKISDVVAKAKEVGKNALEGIKTKLSEFKNVGKDMIVGLANGIKENATSVVNKVKEVGQNALNGLKNFLGIKSPSREFMEIGRYSDEGFAKGLSKFAGVVANSATSVGDSALSSMRKSMAGISEVINDDIDSQPTIRPVLDLSAIRSGANSIGGMFGDASVGVLANVGSISSMMNSRNQNGGNEDVVSAINKLRKDLAGVGNTSYNINGVTYDDGTSVSNAVNALVRAAKIERRR
ncbi:MAG: tape measure protein [Kiritimatiellae bacterium]|nr:tape measure protein [Kiritimatiellia bacterium]